MAEWRFCAGAHGSCRAAGLTLCRLDERSAAARAADQPAGANDDWNDELEGNDDSMCGLAGILHLDGGGDVSRRELEPMVAALASRGPDGTGY